MKTTVGVMGASAPPEPRAEELVFRLGTLIAARKAVLITGAGTGLPLAAARGAHSAGGEVIGFSPAYNQADHLRLGLPTEPFDMVLYTGLGYHGRNLLNVRASGALFFAGGSMGTLNEFTIAYDEQKIMGILTGTGGFCDHLQEWLPRLSKPGNRAVIHYSPDPSELVERIFASLNSGLS